VCSLNCEAGAAGRDRSAVEGALRPRTRTHRKGPSRWPDPSGLAASCSCSVWHPSTRTPFPLREKTDSQYFRPASVHHHSHPIPFHSARLSVGGAVQCSLVPAICSKLAPARLPACLWQQQHLAPSSRATGTTTGNGTEPCALRAMMEGVAFVRPSLRHATCYGSVRDFPAGRSVTLCATAEDLFHR